MLRNPRPSKPWRIFGAIGIALALTMPARLAQATVIGSSTDQRAVASSRSADPTGLLKRLLRAQRPLSWRKPSDGSGTSDHEPVIWPPIDQPLDLRGGYRHLPQAVSEPATAPAPFGATPRLSKGDCEAAGAFILAGARARDQGVTADRLLGQLRSDLLRLGAEPPDTRWFLHSQLEAQLLLSAATRIYREPRAAAWHFTDFVKTCDAHRASG